MRRGLRRHRPHDEESDARTIVPLTTYQLQARAFRLFSSGENSKESLGSLFERHIFLLDAEGHDDEIEHLTRGGGHSLDTT